MIRKLYTASNEKTREDAVMLIALFKATVAFLLLSMLGLPEAVGVIVVMIIMAIALTEKAIRINNKRAR